MFYSRQQIKFSLYEWEKISKKIFYKSGESTREFEKKIKSQFGGDFQVVTGASMRDLLRLVLKYYIKQREQKEVMLSKYNHFSNLDAVILSGGKVVFEGEDKKSKIRLVTQLHGIIQDVTKKESEVIIEDGAHAFGASIGGKMVGTEGVGVFSFGLGKIVTGFGGGAVVSRDKGLVDFLKSKMKGRENVAVFNIKIFIKGLIYQFITATEVGSFALKMLMGILLAVKKDGVLVEKSILSKYKFNNEIIFEMTEMQAEVGLVSIQRYKDENKMRVEKAKIYNSVLKLYSIKKGDVFFHFPAKVTNVEKIKWEGWKNNLDVQSDYCEDVKKLFEGKGEKCGDNGIVYLPTNPEVPSFLIRKFTKNIKRFVINESTSN